MADTTRTLEILLRFKDGFTAGLNKTVTGFRSFAQKAGGFISGIVNRVFALRTALFGLGGVLALRGITSLITKVADLGDKFLKTSQKTGVSVQTLSRLSHAAEMSGVSLDELSRGLIAAEKNIVAMRLGGTELEDVMGLLGPEFEAAVRSGEGMGTLIPRLADAFGGLATEEEKVFVATKLFGKSGADLIPLLEEGGEGIRKLGIESDRLRLTWSKLGAVAANEFGDAFDRLKGSLFGLLKDIIEPLLPKFTSWLDAMTEFVVKHGDKMLDFVAGLVDWGEQLATKVFPQLGAQVSSLASSFGTLLSPLLKAQQVFEQMALHDAKVQRDRIQRDLQQNRRNRGGLARPAFFPLTQEERKELEAELDATRRLVAEKEQLLRDLEGIGKPVSGAGLGVADLLRGAAAERRGGVTRLPDMDVVADRAPVVVTGLDKIFAGVEKLKKNWSEAFEDMSKEVEAVGESLVSNIGDELTAAELGTKSFSKAFSDMTKSILTDLLRIVNRLLVMRALGFVLGGVGKLAGLFSSTGSGGIGASDVDLPASPGGISSSKLGARGTPRTFGPMLAGEAGPEAIIPLPDGRHVPVQMRGGGGTTIINIYNIRADDVESFNRKVGRGIVANRELVGDINAQQFQSRPQLRGRFG